MQMGLFETRISEGMKSREFRKGWHEACREIFFTRIREAAFVLAPQIFPRPPWVSRWAPICTCNGMSVRDFIDSLRTCSSGDGDVQLCSDTARRLAEMMEPHCSENAPAMTIRGNVVMSADTTGPMQRERRFPPISPP
jgi:hypothetical protein